MTTPRRSTSSVDACEPRPHRSVAAAEGLFVRPELLVFNQGRFWAARVPGRNGTESAHSLLDTNRGRTPEFIAYDATPEERRGRRLPPFAGLSEPVWDRR